MGAVSFPSNNQPAMSSVNIQIPEEEEAKPKPQVPPKTCDEWLTSSSGAAHLVSSDGTLPSRKDGIIVWPIHPRHLDFLISAPTLPTSKETKVLKKHDNPGDTIIGSLTEIREDLARHAPWDSSLLDEVERMLEELEASVDASAESFVESEQRPSKASVFGGLSNISDMEFMSELSEELLSLRHLSSSRQQSTNMTDTRRGDSFFRETQKLSARSDSEKEATFSKYFEEMSDGKAGINAESTAFSQHKSSVLVPLPAKLDALAILNLVNSSAKIPQYLVKSWKRIYFCSESVNILQNAFWWIWLDYFQPKRRIQSLLFNQIADDFVSILIKMHDKHKDDVFMRYPVYLAQALYSAFCQAFPGSNQELNTARFLEYLGNITSEWIVGLKNQPEQWKQWPRHFLNPHFLSLQQDRPPTSSDHGHGARFTERDVLSLSHHLAQSIISKLSSCTESTRLPTSKKLQGVVSAKKASRRFQSASSRGSRRESPHGINNEDSLTTSMASKVEMGPVFECVRFSIYGRSPLFQHYLYQHNLSESRTPAGLAMSRTQVKEVSSSGATYKQLLRGHKRKTEKLYREYEDEMARKRQEIAEIRNKHRAYLKRAEQQNQWLLQHHHEVARIAEKLVSSKIDGIMDIETHKLD